MVNVTITSHFFVRLSGIAFLACISILTIAMLPCVCPIGSALAQDDIDPANLAHAELLADVSAADSHPFTVGLHVTIAKGWHIYWKNPGDSGMATTLKITAPDGFKIDAVQYPLPTRIELPGGVTVYGYEDEATLTATVTPPAGMTVGSTIHLSAIAKWLTCDDQQCVPGRAKLELDLPVAEKSKPDHADRFGQLRSQLPDPDIKVRGIDSNADWVGSNADELKLKGDIVHSSITFQFHAPVADVQWFPSPESPTTVSNIDVVPSADHRTSTISYEIHHPAKDELLVAGVLAYLDGAGHRKGFEFGPFRCPLLGQP